MNLLYVCLGNRFRSLLAGAATRKELEDIEVRSRGTEATGPIHQEVKDILEEEGLMEYASIDPTQITQEDIDWADRIIFMSDLNLDYAKDNLELNETKFEIWEIPDADPGDPLKEIYQDIEEKVREMK